MKLLFFTLLLVSMLLSSSFLADAIAATAPAPAPVGGFCDGKCKIRCSRSGNYKRCIHFCGMCCDKCKCVPSGPRADRSECPCYRDWISSKGTPKCP